MSNRRADTRRVQAGEIPTAAPSRAAKMAGNAAALSAMQGRGGREATRARIADFQSNLKPIIESKRTRKAGSPPPVAPLFSPEVQAVLDRMVALSQTEIDAIQVFVDGLVTDGNYAGITEIYAPCLNASDYHTGFKFMTLLDSAVVPVHVPGQFVDFQNGNMHMLDSANFDSFANIEGFIGVYQVFTNPDVTQNSDLFGLADAGGRECYYRWRGNDTNDANVIYCVTGATPRHVGTVRPQGDLVGMGLEGTDVFELQPGGIIEKSARTPEGVPTTHPCQWHGQNLSGAPAAGNVQNGRYSYMMHSNLLASTVVQGSIRTRVLQFLKDIGVTGVP